MIPLKGRIIHTRRAYSNSVLWTRLQFIVNVYFGIYANSVERIATLKKNKIGHSDGWTGRIIE